MKNTFTTAYNRTSKSIKDVSCVEFKEPSMVKQSLSYAVDINTIFDNYCKTGRLPLNGQQPLYDENFVKYDSLIEAQKLVDEASSYFQGLPAKIKNQYGNSLEKFILALNRKDDFLVQQGLLNLPKEEVKPIDVEIPEKPVVEQVNTATDGLSE